MGNITVRELGDLVEGMQNLLEMGNKNLESLNKKYNQIQSDVNFLKVQDEDFRLNQKTMNIKVEEAHQTSIKALEKISNRDYEAFEGKWLSQKELGLSFEPVISSVRIGKILRLLGVAMKNKTRTIPTQHSLKNNIVKTGYQVGGSNTWYWDSEIIKEKFNDLLKDKNLYEDFIKLETPNEVEEFIEKNIMTHV